MPEAQEATSSSEQAAGRRRTSLISFRFVRGRDASVVLNDAQERCVLVVKDRLERGVYELRHDGCPCGESAGTVIAQVDRYGLPLDTVLCQSCGTLRFDPYLSADDLSDFYVAFYQEMYARVTDADIYFRRQQSHGMRLLRFARKVFWPGACVVEIGCGAGGALAVFRENGYRVLGCDYSQPLIEMGRQRGLEDLHFGGIEVLAERLTGSEKADLIFLHHVLEHLSAPAEVLQTANRMLSNRGLIVVAVPDVTGIDRFPFPAGNLRLFLHIAHKYNFTAKGLVALGHRVGLQASVAPVEVSDQAPEMWMAFARQPPHMGGGADPRPAYGEEMLRQLRRIERRFIRDTMLRKLGGPFRRFVRRVGGKELSG